MKATKLSLKRLAFVIAMCIVMLTGVLLFGSMPVLVASATNKTPSVGYDSYTDSDTLINSSYTIRDYVGTLHHSTVGWKDDMFYVTADDPIVQIIPRELFATKGEYLHIGKEYGFFVKTTAEVLDSNFETSKLDPYNNNVEVLVFDITTSTDIKNIETPDLITVKIEPLFQYKYAYIDYRSSTFNSEDYRLVLPISQKESYYLFTISSNNN